MNNPHLARFTYYSSTEQSDQ